MTDLIQEAQSPETTNERLLEIAEEASDDVEILLEIFCNRNCENFEEVLEVLDEDVAGELIETIREKLEENIEAASEEEDTDSQLLVAAFSNAHCSTIEEILEDILDELGDRSFDIAQELKQILNRLVNKKQFHRLESIISVTSWEKDHGIHQDLANEWIKDDPVEIIKLLIEHNDDNEEGDAFVRIAIANNKAVPAECLQMLADPSCMCFAREEYQDSAWDDLELELLCAIIQNPNTDSAVLSKALECLKSIIRQETLIPDDEKLNILNKTTKLIIDHSICNSQFMEEIIDFSIELVDDEFVTTSFFNLLLLEDSNLLQNLPEHSLLKLLAQPNLEIELVQALTQHPNPKVQTKAAEYLAE